MEREFVRISTAYLDWSHHNFSKGGFKNLSTITSTEVDLELYIALLIIFCEVVGYV